ncbi:membrane protein [Agaricicola taiwanensis]|uniref:Membrane protein n=1 Tax=Agaricicola taiwanensis TaxID=591372 RepID=A0A8J2YIZ4_9RHOB|nr:tripartite tricarboxylate transporter TctB family protein [Agaricicola taiwanensis]GGE46155.1 membrane protein [Agaricicola taiwanensis]
MFQVKSPKDVIGGGLLVVFALLLGEQSFVLPLGSSARMGPGYFPLVLCVVLAAMGLLIAVRGFRFEGEIYGHIAWRGMGLVLIAVLFFAFTLRPLGLIPALAGTGLLATLASRRFHLKTAVLLVAALVLFSWAVFVEGLGLPFVLFGSWFG